MVIDVLIFLTAWLYAGIFAVILAMFRDDFNELYESYLLAFGTNMADGLVSAVVTYVVLPITAIYTVKYLWQQRKK